MMQRDPSALRLTHVPTGISVTVYCDLFPGRVPPYARVVAERARSWLAAKLWAARSPTEWRVVRTYHLGSSEQPVLTWAMLRPGSPGNS
jgi:protein subunit release factor A